MITLNFYRFGSILARHGVRDYDPQGARTSEGDMRSKFFGLLAIGFAAVPMVAHATVLTFDGNICDGGQACDINIANTLDQSYGDSAAVDVQYNYLIPGANVGISPAPVGDSLGWWDTGYSDLTNVAWGGTDAVTGTAQIFLKALGDSITLNGFDLGAWPNIDAITRLFIIDATDNSLLFSATSLPISGAVHSSFAGPWTSTTGIAIQWGPDGYDVGIDNIDFTVRPVPEPGTLALLCLGLAGLGWACQRRT